MDCDCVKETNLHQNKIWYVYAIVNFDNEMMTERKWNWHHFTNIHLKYK